MRSSSARTASRDADTTEPAAAALAQMRREAVWYINLINVFYTGLGKSYDDAIQTQRDTIATFIKAADNRSDALHRQGWSPSNEMGAWHAQMSVAFAVAAGTLDPAAATGARHRCPTRSPGPRVAPCSTPSSFRTTRDSGSTRTRTRSPAMGPAAGWRSRRG